MGTRIRTDSVMRPRSSSRGRNASASVTVTVAEKVFKVECQSPDQTDQPTVSEAYILRVELGLAFNTSILCVIFNYPAQVSAFFHAAVYNRGCRRLSLAVTALCTSTNLPYIGMWVHFPVHCAGHFLCDQKPRLAQPGHPFLGRHVSISQRAVMPCSWGSKAGMVRVWVAGKTV